MFAKAAVLFKTNQPLRLVNIKIPKLKKGQVLVKIYYSGICGSQIMEIEGKRGKDKYIPHTLGHEATGRVIDIGRGVTKVKIGDRVFLSWIKGKGIDADPASYRLNNKIINSGKISTFQSHAVISENRVNLLSKKINFFEGVILGCALPTGGGTILNEINNTDKKDNLLIWGAGGVGLSALMIAKVKNFNKIIVVDKNHKKLNKIKKIFNIITLNSNDKQIHKKIIKITNKKGIKYIVESSGVSSSIEKCFKLLNPNGKLVFASHPSHKSMICLDPFELISGKEIKGTWGGATNFERDIKVYNNYIIKNKINITNILNKTYKLEDINNAIEDLKNSKVFRPIISINHED